MSTDFAQNGVLAGSQDNVREGRENPSSIQEFPHVWCFRFWIQCLTNARSITTQCTVMDLLG